MSDKYKNLLERLPKDRWFAAGEYCAHPASLAKLVRLGCLERRIVLNFGSVSRLYDYRRLN